MSQSRPFRLEAMYTFMMSLSCLVIKSFACTNTNSYYMLGRHIQRLGLPTFPSEASLGCSMTCRWQLDRTTSALPIESAKSSMLDNY